MRSVVVILVMSALLEPLHAQFLSELYSRAEARSETLGSKIALLEQAEARYWQAIGAILPSIKIAGNYTWQDEIPSGLGGNSQSWKISGAQPLFKGLREYFGLFQTQNLIKSESFGKTYEILKLREQVAARYFKYLSLVDELKSFDEGERALVKRVQELRSRVQTGRSKRSDVLSAEASLENLRSQKAVFEAQRQIEWENLSFLTGLESGVKTVAQFQKPEPHSESEILGTVDRHPRVLSELHKLEASRHSRRMSWGEHAPTADLSGSYYLHRTGSLRDIEWDIKLDLSIPIFEGGATQSRIREASAKERQAQNEFQKVRRETQLSIQSDLINYKQRREELSSLEKAVELSREAYREQSRQYDLGLVSNLDVLSSLSSYYDTERAYGRSFFELQYLHEKLRLTKEISQ